MQERRGCWSRLTGVFAGLVTLYAVLLLTSLVASLLLPDTLEPVGFLRGLNGVLVLPVIILLPVSLLLRRWRVALLLVPVAVAVIVLYGVYFVPRSGPPVEDGFDVLTFNLKAPEADEVDALIDVIRSANADLVALQEVSDAAAEQIEAALGDVYPSIALFPQDDANAGQGILSRFEIVSAEFFDFDSQDNTLGHIRAELLVQGRSVVLYNVHPLPPFAFSFGLDIYSHGNEVEGVLMLAAQETAPVLLAGDFNMSDQFEEYAQVTRQYADSYREVGQVGFGFTYPGGGHMPVPPVLRLDYIFHDDSFVAESARVWPDVGSSDHHPVWARLALLPDA